MTLEEKIENFPRQFDEGFTSREMRKLTKELEIDHAKFLNILGVRTCHIVKGEPLTYVCDVFESAYCVIEGRQKTIYEWD